MNGGLSPDGIPLAFAYTRRWTFDEKKRKECMIDPEQGPVLIVGAGGGSLSLALLLLQQGIHRLVVNRRQGRPYQGIHSESQRVIYARDA